MKYAGVGIVNLGFSGDLMQSFRYSLAKFSRMVSMRSVNLLLQNTNNGYDYTIRIISVKYC